ncbi:hypothetical protein [Streptomyces sp. NPDC088115]|uniref:hypothetical protein n=1 Tax=Streptomyces sp. NPDC088115 TaxID=3365824 RepID=UPI00382BA162
MSNPLTPDREREIHALERAAASGPWQSDGAEIYGTLGDTLMLDLWVGETLDIDNQAQSNANASFIAAARSAVPDLLAEVERLRLGMTGLHARITELEAVKSTVVAERDAQIIAWLEKKAGEEGTSNKDSRLRRTTIYRLADKLSRGAVRPPLSKGPDPLIVSRFDVAMEPAPEEEQVLTIGCIDENGQPVALLLDMESRSKVARWLAPELNDTGRAATS